ncbi:hypothetical protein [Streptomyces tubercidicus]|uniref:hypothetical protein n=1 Tax=Streptomyces tubercidicus TaxID=47759 RepID=UPI002E0DCF4D|nr:hypothetical protein OG761_21435 [Streptomyces tubercidicus]
MATVGKRQAAGDRVREAERARDDLRDALKAAGVKLPSLGLDVASCAGSTPLALIDLGRCNLATARALSAALRSSAGEQQGAAG